MQKLGLIGGVGPESTILYYHSIVYGVQKRMGKPYFPPLTIESLSSFEVIRMSSQGQYEELTEYLLGGIRNLAAAGADFAALACNTGHMVFDKLQEQSPIPLISIVEVTCAEAKKRKDIKKIGLLGTMATMNATFFKKPFIEAGMEIITPADTEKKLIAQRINDELLLGIVKKETVEDFLQIIQRMIDEGGIQAIILGCTELPLLFKDIELPILILDTIGLHIKALIETIFSENNC